MKRFVFYAVLAAALLVLMPHRAVRAQAVAPTPSPDPHTYSDAAMNFTAPADALLVGRHYVTPDDLTGDLQPVAVWVLHPGKEDMRTISISMEAFEGQPSQWEGQFESQMHNAGGNGLLIRNKTPMTLLNGMPATFVEITSGNGFTTQKQYAIVWADGQRGVVLAESGRLGEASADEAKQVLHDVTAVRYPMQREP